VFYPHVERNSPRRESSFCSVRQNNKNKKVSSPPVLKREERKIEETLETLSTPLPRADDPVHRAIVRDLQGGSIGERGRNLEHLQAGTIRRTFVLAFLVSSAASVQKPFQRSCGLVEHPPSRGYKLDGGFAFPSALGSTRDEEIISPGVQRGTRDVSGVSADRPRRRKGRDRGAVGGVDVTGVVFSCSEKREERVRGERTIA